MNLYELAYACRLYQGEFDKDYREMRKDLGDNSDLDSPEQRDSLLQFLNKWGCRIRRENLCDLEKRLEKWVKTEGVRQLPGASKCILSLDDREIELIG
jgi:hypothetical protein